MNVVQLKQVNQPKAKKVSRRRQSAMRRQAMAAVGVGMVGSALTALSLSHLATGITIVSEAPAWQAWSMAVGVDCGFIALELAQLAAVSEKVAKQVARFAKPAIVGTLIGSAAMNAFAFAAQAHGLMIAPAVIMGVAIPGLIYALTRVAASMYIDCHSKK